jgi:hypothetical protein
MASEVLTDAHVTINSVDLSDHVESVTLNKSAEIQMATAMGDTGQRRLAGLEDWALTVNFYQDYAASKVDATLAPLIGAAAFAIAVRKSDTDAIAATNPEYQGSGMIDGDYPVIAANIGEVSMASVTIVCANGVALIRDVTP